MAINQTESSAFTVYVFAVLIVGLEVVLFVALFVALFDVFVFVGVVGFAVVPVFVDPV